MFLLFQTELSHLLRHHHLFRRDPSCQSLSPDLHPSMTSTISMSSPPAPFPKDQYSIQSKKQQNHSFVEYDSESHSNHQSDDEDEEQHCTMSYCSLWCLFFMLGTFNNFGYVVVLSAAKSLADCFDQSSLIGVESWALIGVGFFIKSLNAFYLESLSHRVRGYMAGVTFLIGYGLLSLSVYIDFWFAIFGMLSGD